MVKFSRKYLTVTIVIAVLAGLSYFAFRPQPVPVDLGFAQLGPMQMTVSGSGTTRIRNVYVISAPVGGQLLRIDKDVGDAVVAGETELAAILPQDPTLLDARSLALAEAAVDAAQAALGLSGAEVDRATAELSYAQADYARTARLAENGNASQARLDQSEMKVRIGQAAVATAQSAKRVSEFDLDVARAQLVGPESLGDDGDGSNCCIRLRSPIGGQILRLLHESQTVISAGTPLMEIGDAGDLEILVDLLSEDAVKVAAGATVAIVQWGGEVSLEGRVRRVEPYGFEKISALGIEEQRVNVVVDIVSPRQQWLALGHGFSVSARIEVWARDDALTVPTGALFRDGDNWAVYVAEAGNAVQRRVEIGRNNGTQAEILGGLEAGTPVILYPSDRIVEAVAITERASR